MQVLAAPPAPFQASFFTSSVTDAGFLLEPACFLFGSTLASRVLPRAPRTTPSLFYLIGDISAPSPSPFWLPCTALPRCSLPLQTPGPCAGSRWGCAQGRFEMSVFAAPASPSRQPRLYCCFLQTPPDLPATVTISLSGHYRDSCCPLTPPDLTGLPAS